MEHYAKRGVSARTHVVCSSPTFDKSSQPTHARRTKLNSRSRSRAIQFWAFATVALACFMLPQILVCENGVPVPEGVRYKTAPQEVNDRARKTLADLFTTPFRSQIADDSFGAMAICGPFLWLKLKDSAEMKKIKTGEVVIHMPMFEEGGIVPRQRLAGKLFQNKEEIRSFCTALAKEIGPTERFKIRRPTKDELRIYWATIPYDIDEPIFVAESKNHTLLVDFIRGKDQIFWVDDFRGVRISASGALELSK